MNEHPLDSGTTGQREGIGSGTGQAGSVSPPPPSAYPQPPAPAGRRSGLWARMGTGLVASVLMFSLALNFYFGAMLASAMSGPTESTLTDGDSEKRIVVVPVNGAINEETAQFIWAALRVLEGDPPAAVVLRITSPGGGVSASDRIWHLLNKFKYKTKIPIVASFGSVAASGGYYIAAACDHIIAEPTTLTGSIGVIAQGFTVQELLGKIGVTPEVIAATAATKKDMLNPMRAWTDEDRNALKVILDAAYEKFVSVVEQGRPALTAEQVKALATGEIFTSQQAQANGLVDQEGYLDAAIEKAKEMAGLRPGDEEPLVTRMSPVRKLRLSGLLGEAPGGLGEVTSETIRRLVLDVSAPRLEYREVRIAP